MPGTDTASDWGVPQRTSEMLIEDDDGDPTNITKNIVYEETMQYV